MNYLPYFVLMTRSIQHNCPECGYTERHVLFIAMLNVIMMSVVKQNVVILNVFILSVGALFGLI